MAKRLGGVALLGATGAGVFFMSVSPSPSLLYQASIKGTCHSQYNFRVKSSRKKQQFELRDMLLCGLFL